MDPHESPDLDFTVELDLFGFSARETEGLSGVHRDTWRDWTRRDLIPKELPPRTRRHVGAICRLYLLRIIAGVQGGSPSAAAPIAAELLPALLARVLADPRAFTPDSIGDPRERVALIIRALGLETPDPRPYAVHRAGNTVYCDAVEIGIAALANVRAAGLFVVCDLDMLAASFLHNANGVPFARIAARADAPSSKPEQKRYLQ